MWSLAPGLALHSRGTVFPQLTPIRCGSSRLNPISLVRGSGQCTESLGEARRGLSKPWLPRGPQSLASGGSYGEFMLCPFRLRNLPHNATCPPSL